MKLTQTKIQRLALDSGKTDQIFFDDELTGFGLRIREGGSRKFVVHYRQGSFQKRHTIGSADVLTLEEARKKARRVLVAVDDGKDPATEKATKRAASALIFSSVAAEYLELRKDHEAALARRMHPAPQQGLETAARACPGFCELLTVAARLREIVKGRVR